MKPTSAAMMLRVVTIGVLASLAACQMISGAASDVTITPVRIQSTGGVPVNGDPSGAALIFVEQNRASLGRLSRDDAFLVSSVTRGLDDLTHVRLRQVYKSVPVWGGDLVVHLSDIEALSLNGTIAAAVGEIEVTPVIASGDALDLAKADYASQAKADGTLDYDRESVELVLLPLEGRGLFLAWHVQFYTEMQGGMTPGLWNYFYEAGSAELLFMFNGIDTLSEASGPGGNAKVVRQWVNNLDVEPSGTQYKMQTSRLVTTNMNHATSGSGTVVVGPLSNISDAAIDDAHGFAEVTLNMMKDWMGQNSIDNSGFVIKSRVHYDTGYENAYWDGTQMTYGDGASTFYPLSGALDVVAHEINHGFTTFHSDLTYSGMSGGLNESFSDVAGKVAEFYYKGSSATWDLGRDIYKGDTALRFMCNPTQDGVSIDDASNYVTGLDVHYSSGVMNKAFCLAAKRLASGSPDGTATQASVKRAGTAWYLANQSYWTASTDFTQACQGVWDAAGALGFSTTEKLAIRDSWSDVGVICAGAVPQLKCDETVTTASGTLTSPSYPSAYPNNYKHIWCIKPASGAAATLTFTAFNTEANYDYVKIVAADGTQLSNTSGTTKPAAATSTLLQVTFTSDTSVTGTGFSAQWTSGGTTPNKAPQASITAPSSGATVSGQITITAAASDTDGTVAKVTFTLPGGTTVDVTAAPYTTVWNSATVANGAAVIKAVAYDNSGAASTQASVNVTVANSTSACINGTFSATGLPLSIPDNSTTGLSSAIAVVGNGLVGQLSLSLHVTHTYQGDLKVTLTSPQGTSYVAWNRTGGSADNIVLTNVAVTTFAGQTAAGTWRLLVQDLASADTGTLDSWSLTVTGSCGTTPPPSGGWSASATPNVATVDNGQVCTSLTVTGTGQAQDVKVDVSGRHDYRTVLRATLAHGGQTLEAFPTNTFASGSGTFELKDHAVAGFTGSATGSWTLCIIDTDAYNDTGTLTAWGVHN